MPQDDDDDEVLVHRGLVLVQDEVWDKNGFQIRYLQLKLPIGDSFQTH